MNILWPACQWLGRPQQPLLCHFDVQITCCWYAGCHCWTQKQMRIQTVMRRRSCQHMSTGLRRPSCCWRWMTLWRPLSRCAARIESISDPTGRDRAGRCIVFTGCMVATPFCILIWQAAKGVWHAKQMPWAPVRSALGRAWVHGRLNVRTHLSTF